MTNETIVLDTPAGINMWVLLSRRAQIKMHQYSLAHGGKGVKGLVACLKREFPNDGIRTYKDGIVAVESAIAMAGGEADYDLVNVHVMTVSGDYFLDAGIYETMSQVESNPRFVSLYNKGALEIVYTLEAPREANGKAFLPA